MQCNFPNMAPAEADAFVHTVMTFLSTKPVHQVPSILFVDIGKWSEKFGINQVSIWFHRTKWLEMWFGISQKGKIKTVWIKRLIWCGSWSKILMKSETTQGGVTTWVYTMSEYYRTDWFWSISKQFVQTEGSAARRIVIMVSWFCVNLYWTK